MNETKEILDYYNAGAEVERLSIGIGKIEFERTKELISRYLTSGRKVIYDIGGGTGIYSRWLSSIGHEVHMFELAPDAVKVARRINETYDNPIFSIEVADGRCIEREDETADMVLLMGPLYHLVDREDRVKVLKEAKRLLKSNGIIICAAISRFGSTLYGLSVYGKVNNLIDEDEFISMIERELRDGQHMRPEKYPRFIPRSFFHLPNELKDELIDSGINFDKIFAVEGIIWFTPEFEEKWRDEKSKEKLLNIVRLTEEEESIMGMSPHILAVGRKGF